MKKFRKNTMMIMLSSLMLTLMLVISSCSETTTTDDQATIKIQSQMSLSVSQLIDLDFKGDNIQRTEVDSVKIISTRILLSRIKFHLEKDSNDAIDKEFKTGPFLFVGDENGSFFNLTDGLIPAGSYNKIKFEIHRFNSSDLSQYQNHAIFKDFATSNRHSVIINGFAYKNGNAFAFTYYGSPTANLTMKFEPSLVCEENSTTNICLQINPITLFKSGNSVCDPRDNGNMNDIDNLIKTAIKAVKKN
jgi:hypothetical protein